MVEFMDMLENSYVLDLLKYSVNVLLYLFSEEGFMGILLSYEIGWLWLVDVL